MIFPIGDTPNPRRALPFVTYLLILANVAVYLFVTLPLSETRPSPQDPLLEEYLRTMSQALGHRARFQELIAQLSAYDLFVYRWGFRPAAPSVATLLASMFLHAGFVHLFGNMLFLWIYGDNVEHWLGHGRFLIAYLLCGAAAVAFHLLAAAGSAVPMVGASGAISGVLGFYFLFFPRNRVRLLWFLPPFVFQVFEVPARIVLGFYIVLDNLLPYLLTSSEVGVAHGAHIGGFFAGLGAAWAMGRRAIEHRPEEYMAAPFADRPAAEEILVAIGEGRYEEAARAYFALPSHATRRLLTVAQGVDLARWLARHGHSDAAMVVLQRSIRDHPREAAVAEACLLAGELLLAAHQEAAAYQYFAFALERAGEGPTADAARRAMTALDATPRRRRA